MNTADLDQAEAELLAIIADRFAKLRAATEVESVSAGGDAAADLIEVGAAARLAGLSKSRMRKLCANHPLNTAGGFGLKMAGRWRVLKAQFERYLANARVSRV